jgi:hypothetical protein
MPTPCVLCMTCGRLYTIGDSPFCPHGLFNQSSPNSNVHSSEHIAYYEDSQGHISIPGRADRPINPKMAAAGYIRREATSPSEKSDLEKRTGLIHEASNYNNSGLADRDTNSV